MSSRLAKVWWQLAPRVTPPPEDPLLYYTPEDTSLLYGLALDVAHHFYCHHKSGLPWLALQTAISIMKTSVVGEVKAGEVYTKMIVDGYGLKLPRVRGAMEHLVNMQVMRASTDTRGHRRYHLNISLPGAIDAQIREVHDHMTRTVTHLQTLKADLVLTCTQCFKSIAFMMAIPLNFSCKDCCIPMSVDVSSMELLQWTDEENQHLFFSDPVKHPNGTCYSSPNVVLGKGLHPPAKVMEVIDLELVKYREAHEILEAIHQDIQKKWIQPLRQSSPCYRYHETSSRTDDEIGLTGLFFPRAVTLRPTLQLREYQKRASDSIFCSTPPPYIEEGVDDELGQLMDLCVGLEYGPTGSHLQSGVLVLPCGAGKTVVGLQVLHYMSIYSTGKIIIVSSEESLLHTWRSMLLRHTYISNDDVVIFQKDSSLEALERAQVIIASYHIMTLSRSSEHTRNLLQQIHCYDHVNLLLDEVQLLSGGHYCNVTDLRRGRGVIVGLTATHDAEEDLQVSSRVGPVLHLSLISELAASGHIADVDYMFVLTESASAPPDPTSHEISYGATPEIVSLTVELITHFLSYKQKIIVISDLKEPLQDLRRQRLPHHYYVDGVTNVEERSRIYNVFNRAISGLLLGTRVVEVGVDLDADVMISISGISGASRRQSLQRAGRVARISKRPDCLLRKQAFFLYPGYISGFMDQQMEFIGKMGGRVYRHHKIL